MRRSLSIASRNKNLPLRLWHNKQKQINIVDYHLIPLAGTIIMQDCLFCQIAQRKIAANIIFEDDDIVAFDDIAPQAPVHKIIIPKRHIATLNDLNKADRILVGHMTYIAQQLAKKLEIAETGYRVLMNCNASGGQTVFHIHLHLLGGRIMQWPPG